MGGARFESCEFYSNRSYSWPEGYEPSPEEIDSKSEELYQACKAEIASAIQDKAQEIASTRAGQVMGGYSQPNKYSRPVQSSFPATTIVPKFKRPGDNIAPDTSGRYSEMAGTDDGLAAGIVDG